MSNPAFVASLMMNTALIAALMALLWQLSVLQIETNDGTVTEIRPAVGACLACGYLLSLFANLLVLLA